MRRCRPWLLALLVLLLCATAVPAGAAVRLHVPIGTVRPGERIGLRWEGLPAGAREAELEISLDGGRWVRLSPELHSLEGSWDWEVPNVSAESARIRLRCGKEHEEEVVAVSEPFRILGNGVRGGRRDFLGEWWPALDDAAPRGSAAGAWSSNAPAFAAHDRRLVAHVPAAAALAAPEDEGRPLPYTHMVGATSALSSARSARPAFVPLRN